MQPLHDVVVALERRDARRRARHGVAVREGGDGGNPIVMSTPESTSAKAMLEIAGKLAQRVSVLNAE